MRIAHIIIFILSVVVLFSTVESFSAGTISYMNVTSIYSDEKGAGLKNPEGVACNEDSLVLVADTANHRLLRYTFQDKTLKEGREIILPQLSYPVRVKLNSRGEIVVLDGKERKIVRLSPEGKYEGYIEPKGLPLPAPFVPRSFDIDRDDNIYALDIFSGRVIVMTSGGEYIEQIGFPKDYGFFSDLSVDFKGNILLIDSINARVYYAGRGSTTFSPLTESLKAYMRFPTDLTTDNRGRIYVVDRNGSQISVIGQDGSFLGQMSGMGWKEGLLNYPSQICINNKGEVFIADTNNNRVQIFTLLK